MGNKDIATKQDRRHQLKELTLKGITSTKVLASRLNCSEDTVRSDLVKLNAYYSKLALNNAYIAELQYGRIAKLLDELEIVKQEFWGINEELKADSTPEHKTLCDKFIKGTNMIKDTETFDAGVSLLLSCCKKLKSVKKKHVNNRLESLKGIINRIDKETKILGLFNPSKVVNNFITVDNLKEILDTMKSVILDFVPPEKRKYAFERMQSVKIKETNVEECLDAEVLDE